MGDSDHIGRCCAYHTRNKTFNRINSVEKWMRNDVVCKHIIPEYTQTRSPIDDETQLASGEPVKRVKSMFAPQQ